MRVTGSGAQQRSARAIAGGAMALLLLACVPAEQAAQGRCSTPEGEANAARARAAAPYAFPELSGRVVDDAALLAGEHTAAGGGDPAPTRAVLATSGLLDPAERASIGARLTALEARTGHQFVVVTVPSLGGHQIEDYGLMLGRTWGIGRKDYDDGVLLIVAPNERKVRIEVGCGLEAALTDEEAAAILEEWVLPAFRERDFAGGISAGVDRIIAEIGPES